MGVGKEGDCPLSLFLPLHHPPSAVSPCIVQAVCLEKLLSTTHAPWGLSGPGFPMAWSCFSLGHYCWLPSALATSRLAWCPARSLRGGLTQQETFPKQDCVESLTACGLGFISLVGAPLAPFLFLRQERLCAHRHGS